jgi:hypothetical protein
MPMGGHNMRTYSAGLIGILITLALLITLPVQAQQEPVLGQIVVPQVPAGSDVPVSGAQGQPSLQITQRPAYFIWLNRETVYVQWSGRGPTTRQFRGEIVTDGVVTDFREDQLESDDYIRRGRNAISWEARAGEGVDGFVFEVGGSADWARFTLMLDGALISTQQIFIGNRGAHPRANPFVFRFRESGGGQDRWPGAYRGQPRTQGSGYFVWVDDDVWHVRWIGRGTRREASGLIATDGRFSGFRRVQLEQDDQIAQNAKLIAWQAISLDRVDGVDFRTSGDQLTFTLLIDGDPVSPSQIFIGANGGHPARNPFRVRR